jgi:hypothetical protein
MRCRRLAAFVLLAASFTSGGCARALRLNDPPRALFYQNGLPQWTCGPVAGCSVGGELRNVGRGCASHLHGIVRLFDDHDREIGSWHWAFPPQQIIDGRTSVPWNVPFISPTDAQLATRVVVEPDWSAVPCSLFRPWMLKDR